MGKWSSGIGECERELQVSTQQVHKVLSRSVGLEKKYKKIKGGKGLDRESNRGRTVAGRE